MVIHWFVINKHLVLSCIFQCKDAPLHSFLVPVFFISFYHATLFWLLLKPKPDNGFGLFQYRNITYLSVAKKRNNILNVEFIMECSKRLPIGYKPQRLVSEFRELDMLTMSSWGKPQCSIMSLLAAHEPQPFNKSSFQN